MSGEPPPPPSQPPPPPSQQPPPPSQQPPPPTPRSADEPAAGGRWQTWQLVAVGALGLLIGLGIGASGDGPVDDGEPAAAPAETVTETVEARGEPAPAETVTVTAAPAEDAAEPPTEAEAAGSLRAGSYSFDDVQVRSDGLGDFEIRSRVTNEGPDREGVCIAATIFSGGSIVGTADACVNDWAGGQTRTLEFISVDDYGDWDEVEFQVEMEY